MPPSRRRARLHPDRQMQQNGLYVHSSPPRALQIDTFYIKQLIRGGDLEKLEQVILDGKGKKLIGEYSADYKTRTYLKSVPNMMTKISLLHDAVNSGRLGELQALLDEDPEKKKKLILAKDEAGVGLLHKAVYYDLTDIANWIAKHFPQALNQKDSEGRTPYHYAAMCRDAKDMQKILISCGADQSILDNKQKAGRYYLDHAAELELPSTHKSLVTSRRSTASKDRLNIKKSNIRIWIHQRNLGLLQQVVWEGHGAKLLVEHSNSPKIKRFLEAVPHIMGLIKDIHRDVQNEDLDSLKSHLNPPAPALALSGKDSNGLTALHKAAGLGFHDVAQYIIETYPNSVNAIDSDGRTPLHYSALAKDDGKMFDFLIESGADESALDDKQKTAAYYKTRTSELDPKLLQVVPECPRTAKESFLQNWDWACLTASSPVEAPKVVRKEEQMFGKPPENPPPSEELTNDVTKPKEEEGKPIETNDDEHQQQESDEEKVKKDEEVSEDDKKVEDEDAHQEGGEEALEGRDEANDEGETESKEHPEEDKKVQEAQPEEAQESEEPSCPIPEPEEANTEEPQTLDNEEEEPNKIDDVTRGKADDDEPADEKEAHENDNESAKADDEKEAKQDDEHEKPKVEKEPKTNQMNGITHMEHSTHVDETEGVIEGVVNGENEVESVNEQGASNDDPDDAEVAALVDEGNMERLAALVLNGDGEKLVGRTSDNPELQAFLDNVPIYMDKINKIHLAAREGNLRDLQAALDRRKFAIARDHLSPNGASPLHVSTVFGNTSIVRYLAGRFPETVQSVDNNGRSPLHYAATLADNGHYYNLLVHLGADTRTEDKFGRTPDYYKTNQKEFSHKTLLEDFGAEMTVEDILTDKVTDDTCSARKDLDDSDMIAVLERCYALLHGRRNSNVISASSSATNLSDTSVGSSITSRHMKRYVFDEVKLRLTKLDHGFYDLIWPSVKKLPQERAFRIALEQDFPLGIVAPDFYVYKVFHEYLEPVIKEWNSIDLHIDLKEQPDVKFFENEDNDNDESEETPEPILTEYDFDLDPYGKWIVSGTLECTRNLANFEMPKSLTVTQLEEVERTFLNVLFSQDVTRALHPTATEDELREQAKGNYYTMNEVLEDPSEIRVLLAANGLLLPLWNIPDSDRLHGKHWPYGRGVFVSSNGMLAAWINVLDHLRIITCTAPDKPGNIGHIYARVHRVVRVLERSSFSFRKDAHLGYLAARPTCLGNTLRFSLTVRFPHLVKEPDNLRHLCNVRGLSYQKRDHAIDAVRIGNQQCLGLTEMQTFADFSTAVANILQLEKDLAMSNSMHIAAMFVNIFRRKKSGLVADS